MAILSELIEQFEGTPEFMAEDVKFDIAMAIEAAMKEQGLTRSQLARKLHVSKSRITQALTGDYNFTILALSKMAVALGCDLSIDLCKRSSSEGHGVETTEIAFADTDNSAADFVEAFRNKKKVNKVVSFERALRSRKEARPLVGMDYEQLPIAN